MQKNHTSRVPIPWVCKFGFLFTEFISIYPLNFPAPTHPPPSPSSAVCSFFAWRHFERLQNSSDVSKLFCATQFSLKDFVAIRNRGPRGGKYIQTLEKYLLGREPCLVQHYQHNFQIKSKYDDLLSFSDETFIIRDEWSHQNG